MRKMKVFISAIVLILSVIAYISSIFNIIGIKGSLKLGLITIFVVSLISFIYLIIKNGKIKLGYPKNISMNDFLKTNIYISNELIYICSAGDQLRHFLASMDVNIKLKNSLSITLFLRNRIDDDTVYKNLDRIDNISKKVGFSFNAFGADWEMFNISAIICDNKRAIINFYSRNENQTFPVWSDYKLIERSKNEIHDDLFKIIDAWMSNCNARYTKLEI